MKPLIRAFAILPSLNLSIAETPHYLNVSDKASTTNKTHQQWRTPRDVQ